MTAHCEAEGQEEGIIKTDRYSAWLHDCQKLCELDTSLNFSVCMCGCGCILTKQSLLRFHLFDSSFFLTPSFIPSFPQSFLCGFFFFPLSFLSFAVFQQILRAYVMLSAVPATGDTKPQGVQLYSGFGLAWR